MINDRFKRTEEYTTEKISRLAIGYIMVVAPDSTGPSTRIGARLRRVVGGSTSSDTRLAINQSINPNLIDWIFQTLELID